MNVGPNMIVGHFRLSEAILGRFLSFFDIFSHFLHIMCVVLSCITCFFIVA